MAGRAGREIYRTQRWRRLRLAIFERDGWRCVLCGRPGRLECDHKKPIASGGDWWDPDNLRTVCRSCHIRLTVGETQAAREAARPGRAEMLRMAREQAANG